ncbi:MAG: GAF domain-containing protein, partial [Myxococcales bacterium]
ATGGRMGTKLVAYFAEAERLGGMHGKLQLAGLTRMTSTQATSVEDTPELLARFDKAIGALKQQPKTPAAREVAHTEGDPRVLRRQLDIYLDLMTQRSLLLGDVAETVRRVTEAAANALDVARVSVWWIDDARTRIQCADLFERATRTHASGTELRALDFPAYFAAIEKERTIAASDAHRDPRTSCFSASYLTPLNITAMLDVPIWANGRMIGVVCHEHVGSPRLWSSDDEKFAYLMSAFVSLAAERARGSAP